MTLTLADVLLLTGLDISSSDTLFSYRGVKPSHRLETKNVGGWAGYITEHMKDGTVSDGEHVAFLNMWLEKFVFCGKSFGPTSNCQIIAERLAHGSSIPLGKYLLGSVYNLLHQVIVSLSTKSPIGSLGGPWWFINLWLNLYFRDKLEQDNFNIRFLGDQPDGAPIVRRRCMNFGEVASMFPGHKKSPSRIAEHFRSFYLGFNPGSIIWFAYRDDDNNFEILFSFDDIHRDDENMIAFVEIIKPGILPSCVFAKDQLASYEFYNPSVSARQLSFGQLPIGLYFSDLVKPREIIPDDIHYRHLLDWVPDSSTINLDFWRFSSFSSLLFNIWWAEWYDHVFCVSLRIPYIGYNAPSISLVMQGPKIIPPPDSVLIEGERPIFW
jgi:hypothetical protein